MSTTFMSPWLSGTFRNQQLLPSTVNSNWLCHPVLSFWDRRCLSLNLLLSGSITRHATMTLLFGSLVHVIACRFFSVLFFWFAYRSHGAVILALAFVDHRCQHRHFSTSKLWAMNTAVVLLALLSACVFCCRVLSFGYGAPASHHPIFKFRQPSFCHRLAYHAIVIETAFATCIFKHCAVVALLIFSFLNISLNFLQSFSCFSFTSI